MITVVTGIGPRVGTSFVMNEARKAGLPIAGHKFLPEWTVPKHNPEGYWDLDPFEFIDMYYSGQLNNKVVKAWGPLLAQISPGAVFGIVLLERKDKKAQLASINKVMQDEKHTEKGKEFSHYTAEQILEEHINAINMVKINTVLKVYTEDLNTKIDKVIKFLERGFTCQHS
jgi:hypothetical protein